jgi:hypothetical protein
MTPDNALLKTAFWAIQNIERIWNKTTFNRGYDYRKSITSTPLYCEASNAKNLSSTFTLGLNLSTLNTKRWPLR